MSVGADAAWAALDAEAARLSRIPTRDLVGSGAGRFEAFSCEGAGLLLDFSRQHVDATVIDRLCALADSSCLRSAVDAMFRGDVINPSERRPALHVALRQQRGDATGGAGVERQVMAERARILEFSSQVREGRLVGATGERFRTVVNIGIGGSDLGPAMAVEALRPFCSGEVQVAFVSNVDGCALFDLLESCDPGSTLFIIASKTFTTQETMANAAAARRWIVDRLGVNAVPAHFAAVSVNTPAMDAFGVNPAFRFAMWDWVGGRYSVWSSIGVSLAIAIGPVRFVDLLEGARALDHHFRDAPWRANLPVMMALLGAWNINLLHLPTLAVLPYDSRLARFPAFLQQLEMESNGKSVGVDGMPVRRETAPVVWGEPGNNAQHSFFQLLHQGTRRAALDFILPARSSCGLDAQHRLAIANCLAQADVFMRGQVGPDVPSHKVHEGGRPSSLILFSRLDPRTLGALIAAYEHKVYAQSILWGINAFDQWGVELGKQVASGMLRMLEADIDDPSVAQATRGTLAAVRRLQR